MLRLYHISTALKPSASLSGTLDGYLLFTLKISKRLITVQMGYFDLENLFETGVPHVLKHKTE